jgi:hypothetical protein
MNLWTDIESGSNVPEEITVVVEIPTGSRNKYEYDKEKEALALDRVLFSPFHYPAEYGFMPKSLWEAARMDGCSEMRYFIKIVVPLSKSIVAAQVLNSFIWIYNSYLWPLLVTSTENMRTIQTGIANLVRDMYWNPGGALAGTD